MEQLSEVEMDKWELIDSSFLQNCDGHLKVNWRLLSFESLFALAKIFYGGKHSLKKTLCVQS